MTLWPQMVFTDRGPQFHADQDQLWLAGHENTVHSFIRLMRRAVAKFKYTRKGIVFRRFHPAVELFRKYRYPPRIFVEHAPADLSPDMTFILAYSDERDRRKALHAIDQWNSDFRFNHWETRLGSELPVVRNRWNHHTLLRALAKLGLNLLFDTVIHTKVDSESFKPVVEFVRLGFGPRHAFFHRCGFVRANDLDYLRNDDGGHGFQLVGNRGWWHIMFSFFGGRAAGYVCFPGRNDENWVCARGSTPLKSSVRDVSKEWKVWIPRVPIPTKLHIAMGDPLQIMPSVEILNARSEMQNG